MTPWTLPSGRQRGIAFILPDDWTPEQAFAVLELLDDLREQICAHYQIPIQDFLRDDQQYQPLPPADTTADGTDDPSF